MVRPVQQTGYNAFGEQTHTRDANGHVTGVSFDVGGRQRQIIHPQYLAPSGERQKPTETYDYDQVGNLVKKTSRRGFITSYSFDAMNRVVKVTAPQLAANTPAGVTRVDYDDAGQRTSMVNQVGARTSWTYDDLGRTSTTTRHAAGKAYTSKIEYDDLDRPVRVIDPTGSVATTEYDSAGNPIKVTDPLGKSERAEYDMAGRKTASVDKVGRRVTRPGAWSNKLLNPRPLRPPGRIEPG